jgi:predicted alpha/beta superfamily hydrolase
MQFKRVWILLFVFSACSPPHDDVIIGNVHSIYSNILKENRIIWVHVPGNPDRKSSIGQHYPVVYLLDGDAHFASVMGLMQQLSEVNGNTLFPEMILVGILNTDRMRDLTPTAVSSTFYGDSSSVSTSGGGEKFTEFLERELIPHIDSLYPTAPYRIMIGHSLGGLMTINTLIHHDQLFNAYLAIDPSMWWDGQKLLQQADTALSQNRFNGKSLFLSIANTMPPGMDTAMVRKDTTGNTLHIRSILKLSDDLKKNKENGLTWSYKYYEQDNHGSVPLISEYNGLRFIFDFYRFPASERLFDNNFTAASAIAAVNEHYKHISGQMGYGVLPTEGYINGLGYNFLQRKMYSKAEAFFMLNIKNFPKSANVYDSMGDYYVATGDTQNAKSNYVKALSIEENPVSRRKLEKLNGGK